MHRAMRLNEISSKKQLVSSQRWLGRHFITPMLEASLRLLGCFLPSGKNHLRQSWTFREGHPRVLHKRVHGLELFLCNDPPDDPVCQPPHQPLHTNRHESFQRTGHDP